LQLTGHEFDESKYGAKKFRELLLQCSGFLRLDQSLFVHAFIGHKFSRDVRIISGMSLQT
jgi:hypothetical protein